MLAFNVAQLLNEPVGATRCYDFEQERLDGELALQDLQGQVCLTRLRGEILLKGWAEGKTVLECSRCLETYALPLRVGLEIEFRPRVALPEKQQLDQDRDDFYWIEQDHVLDLGECLQEAFILALPLQPLCRPDCAGLCPICGKNLNEGPCGGHAEMVDERLAILASLLSEVSSE